MNSCESCRCVYRSRVLLRFNSDHHPPEERKRERSRSVFRQRPLAYLNNDGLRGARGRLGERAREWQRTKASARGRPRTAREPLGRKKGAPSRASQTVSRGRFFFFPETGFQPKKRRHSLHVTCQRGQVRRRAGGTGLPRVGELRKRRASRNEAARGPALRQSCALEATLFLFFGAATEKRGKQRFSCANVRSVLS